ncbi:MAG: cadmium-translocating P-type ATPase [Proteocatella sp.]|nr:cadmium-translocating P-type ATPase [Proteocatella sp.]
MRIVAAAAIYAAAFMVNDELLSLLLNVAAYIIIGYDVVIKALSNIFKGEVFDENFLMTIATVGAFAIGESPEAVAVMLFYQIGEFFQDYAVSRSKKSIADLMDIRPDYANLKINDEVLVFSPEEVELDDIIVIKPGERVPLDAVVTQGSSSVDTSALTGESIPRDIKLGDEILSGSININSVIEARVIRKYKESTASRILDLVENAASKKSKSEKFITRFARYYTPAVVVMAALLAIGGPLVTGDAFSQWISRALIFLVISCPCALVISVPLSFFGGIGGASRRGILVKGSNYLESLAMTEIAVFDKTGTLTRGVFEVHGVKPSKNPESAGIDPEELLELAAYAENYSSHPISVSLKKAYGKIIDSKRIGTVEEIAGHGVKAVVDGRTVFAGNSRLMEIFEIGFESEDVAGTVVHIAVDGKYAGHILISDELKEDAKLAIQELKRLGVKKTVILTGDSKSAGDSVARILGADEVYTELLPGDKVDKIEELMKELSTKGKLVFVGDGINDAPVLARSDTGIAMGGLGSDAAIEAADVVIMTDEPLKVTDAIRISRKTLGIARQNIIFALGVKAVVMILGAAGMANMWAAVFADVGVTFIAVINSMRAMSYEDRQ